MLEVVISPSLAASSDWGEHGAAVGALTDREGRLLQKFDWVGYEGLIHL